MESVRQTMQSELRKYQYKFGMVAFDQIKLDLSFKMTVFEIPR
jgi:hypothetical protein